LALDVVVLADDRGLRDRLVVHQRRLDLHRGDAVAGFHRPPLLVEHVPASTPENGRLTVGQRRVDDVRVARDPADAGGARVDVLLVEIEDPPVSRRDAREIAPGGVDDALGLARRARAVEEVEQSSESGGLAGPCAGAPLRKSFHQMSRPSRMSTFCPVRRYTITVLMPEVPLSEPWSC
jgi:hypothetical protein